MSTPARIDHFTALVERQPANELFRFSLAQAFLAEDRPADAIAHLEFCVTKKPDWMLARILLGKALLSLGRQADARRWLEEALNLAIEQHHEDPETEVRALLAGL